MYLFKLAFLSFPDTCPGVGLLDHMVILFLVFLKNHQIVFQWLHQLTVDVAPILKVPPVH